MNKLQSDVDIKSLNKSVKERKHVTSKKEKVEFDSDTSRSLESLDTSGDAQSSACCNPEWFSYVANCFNTSKQNQVQPGYPGKRDPDDEHGNEDDEFGDDQHHKKQMNRATGECDDHDREEDEEAE